VMEACVRDTSRLVKSPVSFGLFGHFRFLSSTAVMCAIELEDAERVAYDLLKRSPHRSGEFLRVFGEIGSLSW
jgi:hypothetical protein